MIHRGLSPRVRGIPQADVAAGLQDGSIPACTGNPPVALISDTVYRVYPRVYGESRHRCCKCQRL